MTNADDRERERMRISLLAVTLPDFLDMVERRLEGNKEQAALSLLGAIPPGGDTTLLEHYCQGIEWAVAVEGMDAVRSLAAEARDLPAGGAKTAKIDELAALLNITGADALVNEVLGKLQQGQTPTNRDLRILTAAKNLYRDADEAR
jgi:hypothetical protein